MIIFQREVEMRVFLLTPTWLIHQAFQDDSKKVSSAKPLRSLRGDLGCTHILIHTYIRILVHQGILETYSRHTHKTKGKNNIWPHTESRVDTEKAISWDAGVVGLFISDLIFDQ